MESIFPRRNQRNHVICHVERKLFALFNDLVSLARCSGHTSATTWNSAKSEGTASDECA